MDSAIRHFLDFEKISTNEVRHILDLGYKIKHKNFNKKFDVLGINLLDKLMKIKELKNG